MLTYKGPIEYFFVEKVEAPASHLIDALKTLLTGYTQS